MSVKIELGQEVKDKVTGFSGIATSHIRYLTGCDQIGVTPPTKDGKCESIEYFDHRRLDVIGDGINAKSVQDETNPGGPNRDCPKH